METGRSRNIFTFDDAYKVLGMEEIQAHPGHPVEPTTLVAPESVEFDIHAFSSYIGKAEGEQAEITVVEINKKMYPHVPSLESRALAHLSKWAHESTELFQRLNCEKKESNYSCLMQCIGILCRSFSQASTSLRSAIPVRVGFDYDEPYIDAPQQWATILSFKDDRTVILPLSLDLRGPLSIDGSNPDRLLLQGWTIDHTMLKSQRKRKRKYYEVPKGFYRELTDALCDFKYSAVLHITDVDMLFRRNFEGGVRWRPRRFSTAWTLYDSMLHASSNQKIPAARARGAYSCLSALLEEVYHCGSKIRFTNGYHPQPFQLLRQGEFTIVSSTACRSEVDHIVTTMLCDISYSSITKAYDDNEQLDVGSDDLQSDDSNNDRDGHEDEVVRQDDTREQHTQGIDDSRARHRVNLRAFLQTKAREVDGKHMCRFKTCRLPQASGSRYCEYHSISISQLLFSRIGQAKTIGKAIPMARWELGPASEHKKTLRLLKEYLVEYPSQNWIIDCEFITVKDNGSIPLQISLRHMDGTPLFDTTVDYGMSVVSLLEEVAKLYNYPLGAMVARVYNKKHTWGMKPSAIKRFLLDVLKYDPKKNSII